jgi:hypothetical protein
VIAIADLELVGKYFEEGKLQLDIKESFYKGEEINIPEAKSIILFQKAEDATFNIVGEKSVNLALEMGIINQKQIGRIANIPFALILA